MHMVEDVSDILRTKYAVFTGGHDRDFRSLITFPDVGMDTVSDEALAMLMQYYNTLAPCLASNRSCVALIDRRNSDWSSVMSVLKKIVALTVHVTYVTFDHVYILKPQGFLQKFFVRNRMNELREETHLPLSFADNVNELSSFIDPEHLPTETGGLMSFNIENWIQDRISIEVFRRCVESLCQRETELRSSFGKIQCKSLDMSFDRHVSALNAAYLPPVFGQTKKQRRQWLEDVNACEATGLQLRRQLLDHNPNLSDGGDQIRHNTEQETIGKLPSGPAAADASFSTSLQPRSDSSFDLPVDRVFHDISLTHLLLDLTEARTRFNHHWSQVTQRVKVAKRIREVDWRFRELRPFSDIWGNLLESALDYHSVGNGVGSFTSSGRSSFTHNDDKLSVSATNGNTDDVRCRGQDDLEETRSTFEPRPTSGPEGLEAVVSRLTEAEQLASRLLPDLERLARDANWLISYVPHYSNGSSPQANALTSPCDSVTSSVTTVVPDSPRTVHLPVRDDSSGRDSAELPSPCGAGGSTALPVDLPALRLPPNATAEWPALFNRLIELARVDLPRAVDQLYLLVQLHAEINSARGWCTRGRSLVSALHQPSSPEQVVNLNSLSLAECRATLDELSAFCASKEATLELLTDPRLFHLKFSPIMNVDLRSTLKDLLCCVEEVEYSCRNTIALLRQHISRLSFPRHHAHTKSFSSSSPCTRVSSGQTATTSGSVDSPRNSSASPFRQATTTTTVSTASTDKVATELPTVVSPARRYQLAWEELVDTERAYVNFLHHVYQVVWPVNKGDAVSVTDDRQEGSPPPAPSFLHNHPSWLLVNWPELVGFHQDFLLPTLEACSGNGMKVKQWATQVVPRLVDLYSVYCSLHDSAVQVACYLEKDRVYCNWLSYCSEEVHKREIHSPVCPIASAATATPTTAARPILQLSSRLVTPVQRFQRYHLLLHRLMEMALTESSRDDLKEAHKTMLEMCELVNMTMRFHGLSTRPSELGRLLLRGDFSVSRTDTRAMSNQQCHVFLFTNTILLSKFRLQAPSTSPVLAMINYIGAGSASGGCDLPVSEPAPGRSTSNQYLSSLPLHASNLIALAKSHAIGSSGSGSNSSLTGSGLLSAGSDQRPVYEIKEELPLAQIGLTPSVRADRRRFAIWTANRAQTYVFHSSDPNLREKWVCCINDLLMGQLRRLRDEALQRYLPQLTHTICTPTTTCLGDTPTRIGCISGVTSATSSSLQTTEALPSCTSGRSSSLPISTVAAVNRIPSDNISILSLPLDQNRGNS